MEASSIPFYDNLLRFQNRHLEMEANGVDVMASGDVRFIFRSDETDVNVTIEGKREWVERIVDELGLSDVGSFIPLGQNPLAQNQPDAQEDDDDVLSPPLDLSLIHISEPTRPY